jgi:hypothetical protein
MNKENNSTGNIEKEEYWQTCLKRAELEPKTNFTIDVITNEGTKSFDSLDNLFDFAKNNSFYIAEITWVFPGDETWGHAKTDLTSAMLHSLGNDKEIKKYIIDEVNKNAARTLFNRKYPNA